MSRVRNFPIALIPFLLLVSALIALSASRARAQDDAVGAGESATITQDSDNDGAAVDQSAAIAQDSDASDEDVAGKADYVGDWSGTIDDRRLGLGSIDISLLLTTPKHGKSKLKGTYEINLGGRDRKGKTNPTIDKSGAIKLNLRFGISGRSCAINATGVLANPDEIKGTYRAGGCGSKGTFDVTK
jgi:hypothetical protein